MATRIRIHDLDSALSEVQVMHKGQADPGVVDWWPESLPWAVTRSCRGVVALFSREPEANAFRMLLVNMLMNVSTELLED